MYDSPPGQGGGYKVISLEPGAPRTCRHDRSITDLPVLGVPIQSKSLSGLDSLLSIVQMPSGVPVGTLAIGEAGARNAGLLAAQILACPTPRWPSAWQRGAAQSDGIPDRRGLLSTVFPSPPDRPSASGGGQLGPDAGAGAARLGFDVAILDPEDGAPAARVPPTRSSRPMTTSGLAALAPPDVVTFEFENVPPRRCGSCRMGAQTWLARGRWRWRRIGWRRTSSTPRQSTAPSPPSTAPATWCRAGLGAPLLLKTGARL